VVIVYNEENCIGECLEAILSQEFQDFELIVVDDGSTDGTPMAIGRFNDSRIKYIRQKNNCGVAASRNMALQYACGRYIFFTDADCIVTRFWLKEGLRVLKEGKCLGVEGRSFYASSRVTISDISFEALKSGHFSTSNIAFTKEALEKAGNFNPRYSLNHEDLDLALRINKYGKIDFCEDMIVVHRQEHYTVKGLFRYMRRARDTVRFIKDHPEDYRQTLYWRNLMWHRILYPKKLLIMLFPFLLILCYNFRSWKDIKLLPWVYISVIYMRLILWKEAAKEKIFLI